MKFLAAVVLFAVIIPAHAFVSLSCSSATGSVVWEEGENSNMAWLEYDGFVSGILEIERHKLNIVKKEEVTLREQLLSQCGANSMMTTFAARVEITPAPEYPNALLSYFPENLIKADVICERIVSAQADCHP